MSTTMGCTLCISGTYAKDMIGLKGYNPHMWGYFILWGEKL